MVYLTDGTPQILAAPERGGGGEADGGVNQVCTNLVNKV